LKKAGLADKHVHDLRRTAIRTMTNLRINEQHAMKISDHETREVFRRYNIKNRENIHATGDKLAAHFKGQKSNVVVNKKKNN
jgi:hypothetical protein